MNDEEAYEFYKNPENLRPAGPWVAAWVRPGLRELVYTPPECGPRSKTLNTGSLPHWVRNPDTEET